MTDKKVSFLGLGFNEIKNQIPNDVDVACRNSASSCTISGPIDSINAFVSQLKSEGVFAKTVNVAGIAFHSRYIQPAGPTLLKYLKEVSASIHLFFFHCMLVKRVITFAFFLAVSDFYFQTTS